MEESQGLPPDQNWLAVIEKIKQKYEQYGVKDDRTYPPLLFNSTPEPYQHLVESFKAELSLLLGKSANEVVELIPSPSLFAQIFRTNYRPTGKKLHGCYLYATGQSKLAYEKGAEGLNPNSPPVLAHPNGTPIHRRVMWFGVAAGLIALVGILTYLAFFRRADTTSLDPLTIEYPINNQLVPQRFLGEGKAPKAAQVWIGVRWLGQTRYWIGPPVKADKDGRWKDFVHVGDTVGGDLGLRAQIRVFANLDQPLKEGGVLSAWPKAQYVSPIVEVIKGPNLAGPPTGLRIEKPVLGEQVFRLIYAEGQAFNTKQVWVVVHANDGASINYFVQDPIEVENGRWKGAIFIVCESLTKVKVEIRAFVNPTVPIYPGQRLAGWPKAQLTSNILQVVRNRQDDI